MIAFPFTNTALLHDEMPCFARNLRTGDLITQKVTLTEDCIKQMLPGLGKYMAKNNHDINSLRLVESAKAKMAMSLDYIAAEILANGPSEEEKASGFRNGVIMYLTATGPEDGSLVIKQAFFKFADEVTSSKIVTKKIYNTQKDEGKTV